jgi:hypothetical protein
MTTNFAALHMSAPGTVLTKPDLALCPQLAGADIRPVDGNSGCDPLRTSVVRVQQTVPLQNGRNTRQMCYGRVADESASPEAHVGQARPKRPPSARPSSAADLQSLLDQRARELAEAQKHLAEALERQTATAEISQRPPRECIQPQSKTRS